jgi:hypothetical protein
VVSKGAFWPHRFWSAAAYRQPVQQKARQDERASLPEIIIFNAQDRKANAVLIVKLIKQVDHQPLGFPSLTNDWPLTTVNNDLNLSVLAKPAFLPGI